MKGGKMNMVVYKELSSLCHDLGFSARALYTASNTIENHYHDVYIPKANGEKRLLHVPDDYLKAIQKRIARNILSQEEISPYAVAYRVGGSTKANASPHVGHEMVMKCDIRKFFDHITFPMLREKVFPIRKYSESNSILLSILCVYSHSTPQGAPTSPAISNIILREFDNSIGAWCRGRGITYTRYCDDMTFSGLFNPIELKSQLQRELYNEGFFLNSKKTVVLRQGQKMEVTGIVVNEKVSIPSQYKKNLRQEIYYCKKYGIESHLLKVNKTEATDSYRAKLFGRVNYILSVEPDNEEMKGYKQWLLNQMKV